MRSHRREAEELLAESRRAVDVLTRLVARLETYTDRVEAELQRLGNGGDDDRTAGK